jgi:hypothetical protein
MNAQERMRRVTALTSAWIDGRATDAEIRELNDHLNGDPEACERYLDLVEIHAALIHDRAGDRTAPGWDDILPFARPAADGGKKRAAASRWTRKGWAPLAAAAALVALLTNAALLWWRPAGDDGGDLMTSDGGVAVLSRVVDPEWPDAAGERGEGDAIPAGRFAIRSGLAQIEFFSGATVIVEGPAELDLESAWRVVCRSGRLRAFVPEPAQGFTIVTPDYEAVDLGTEFALSVGGDGRSEVHVVDGEIRLDDAQGRALHHLTAGAAMQSADGALSAIESRGDAFIDRQQLMRLAQNDWRSRYADWRQTSEKLAQDADTVVYYDFENQDPWDRALESRLPDGPGGGAIIGAQWTQGRWPGKGALEFKRITDRVRIRVPGDFDALTLSAWVRPEGFDRWLSSLMLTDGWEPGEVHWQISNKGQLILGVAEGANHFSEPVIHPRDLGRWLHLAVTIDRGSETGPGRIVHYVDGESVGDLITGRPLPPLRIGDAEIGNWQAEGRDNSIRSLNGRLDEFVILKRALTAEEIRAMHAAGLPNG